NDFACSDPLQILPTRLNLIEGSHVCHGAAGAHIRQNDFLIIGAEDVGAFSHEGNAAENNVFGVFAIRRPLRQLEGIPAEVGELDHLIALIMMPENDQTATQLFTGRTDSAVEFSVIEARYALGQKRL